MTWTTTQYPHRQAIQQLLGKDLPIVSAQKWLLNKNISLYSAQLLWDEVQLPSQFGQIVCPLLANDEHKIQLMYVKHEKSTKANVLVFSIEFEPEFLAQWDIQSVFAEEAIHENIHGLQINICKETQTMINALLATSIVGGFAEKLAQIELSLGLLRKAMQQIGSINDTYSVPACGFLSNNSEREKVIQAKEILDEAFDQMLSIKELSRRVAINECYLKKGFKTMFGKTINEYQQGLRIAKAKTLLQTQAYSVSDVAHTLGYSSISHFSTAFKKATNMKPCELLK
jgi:AraC-like DNA-binding protein